MELTDTVAMMTNADYKERFRAEYYQVKIRYDRLCQIIEDIKNEECDFDPTCTIDILFAQVVAMEGYLKILQFRAELEDVELEESEAN